MGKVVIRGASTRQQVIDMLMNGSTLDEAAAATGYGRNYVRQLGAKEGIRFPRGKYGPHKTHKYDTEQIVALHSKGLRPKEIAEVLGVKSQTTIYKALRCAGVQLKKGKIIIAYEMRFCKECNAAFLCDPRSNKLFCSDICQKANSHRRHDIIRRARRRAVIVDDDITLEKLAIRDHGICYLCGLPIDWDDYQIINGKKYARGEYPSIDHMIPISRGGMHSWDNVRLAHFSCNASKGVSLVG